MSVRVKATAFRGEMFGTVVDMPTPNILIIKTVSQGFFTIHDVEVSEYFYA